MTKKITLWSVIVTLITFTIIFLGLNKSFAQEQKSKDRVVITLRNDLPPLSFQSIEGKPAGLFVDIWSLWSEKTGMKIEFKMGFWEDTLENLRNGSADIHGALFYSDDRNKWMIFSQPIYGMNFNVFFAIKHGEPQPMKELKGEKIGVIGGTTQEKSLQKDFPAIELVPFRNISDMIYAALNNQIRAFVTTPSTINALLNQLGLTGQFKTNNEIFYDQAMYAGVLKDKTDLLSIIDKGFDSILDEELTELEVRWIYDMRFRYFKPHSPFIRLTKSEQLWLRQNKTVKISIPDVFPPLMFIENGSFKGIFPDYLDMISKITGIKFEMSSVKLSELSDHIKSRQTDIVPMFVNLEKDGFINFTDSFGSLPWVVSNRICDPLVMNIKELRGKKVKVVRNVPVYDFLIKNYPEIEIDPADKPENALKSIAEGKADAFVGALPVVGYLIYQCRIANVKIAGPVGCPDTELKFAVQNDMPELLNILNKVIRSVSAQEQDKIIRKWISVRYEQVHWEIVWKWVSIIALVFVITLGMSLFWNTRLSKEIKDRKIVENNLRESESRYQAFFETIGHGVIYQDRHGKITDANPSSERILGLKKDQMKGRAIFDFGWRIIREDGSDLPFDDFPSTVSLMTGQESDAVIIGIISSEKKDLIWIKIKAVPQFKVGQNKPYQVYSIFEDITDKKLIENRSKSEIESLRQYLQTKKSSVTSEYFGIKSIRSGLKDTFEHFIEKYAECMEFALEKEVFKVDNNISAKLQHLAEELGFYNAGPRDLVDIHVQALQRKIETLNSRKAQVYADIGRIMLVEVMGYLVSFYRNRCVSIRTNVKKI